MNNRDKTFLQKLKDNAFYLSVGLGLCAILALVGVYTAQQNDMKMAENNMDLNVASDYSDLEDGVSVTEADADVSRDEEITEKKSIEANDSTSKLADDLAEMDASEEGGTATSSVTAQGNLEKPEDSEVAPASTDPGQLDFNSEKTITWPVNGEVILPYSMETTVHFKTLDQYQCNPGMLIEAGVGTTVQNAYLGQVTSVTSDNTYGNMVTLYIGNEYSIVYGQLDAVYVKEGDFVKAGQSIGTVGNPTDSFAKEGSHLFFQMKSGDETVDPMLFIE